jgi:hypothetical protein
MIIINLYGFSLFAIVPYYNWRYANEQGFVKWLFFGEIIATAKSVVWPYFVFFAPPRSSTISSDERYYTNSQKACDEAMKIIVKAGDVSRLASANKLRVHQLVRQIYGI